MEADGVYWDWCYHQRRGCSATNKNIRVEYVMKQFEFSGPKSKILNIFWSPHKMVGSHRCAKRIVKTETHGKWNICPIVPSFLILNTYKKATKLFVSQVTVRRASGWQWGWRTVTWKCCTPWSRTSISYTCTSLASSLSASLPVASGSSPLAKTTSSTLGALLTALLYSKYVLSTWRLN